MGGVVTSFVSSDWSRKSNCNRSRASHSLSSQEGFWNWNKYTCEFYRESSRKIGTHFTFYMQNTWRVKWIISDVKCQECISSGSKNFFSDWHQFWTTAGHYHLRSIKSKIGNWKYKTFISNHSTNISQDCYKTTPNCTALRLYHLADSFPENSQASMTPSLCFYIILNFEVQQSINPRSIRDEGKP